MAEPSAFDDRTAASVADRLVALPSTMSGTRLLAIDGPAGSGKTSLARDVGAVLTERGWQASILSLDDLYDGWTGLNPTLEDRVLDQVLLPLTAGSPARWQAYDWRSGHFADWHDVASPDVLVIEGCGAGARRYASYTTLLVWVEADARTRAERAVARDGGGVLQHWADWARSEASTFAANDTRARAGLRLTT